MRQVRKLQLYFIIVYSTTFPNEWCNNHQALLFIVVNKYYGIQRWENRSRIFDAWLEVQNLEYRKCRPLVHHQRWESRSRKDIWCMRVSNRPARMVFLHDWSRCSLPNALWWLSKLWANSVTASMIMLRLLDKVKYLHVICVEFSSSQCRRMLLMSFGNVHVHCDRKSDNVGAGLGWLNAEIVLCRKKWYLDSRTRAWQNLFSWQVEMNNGSIIGGACVQQMVVSWQRAISLLIRSPLL